MAADQQEENAIVKLLVLGTGESGKSTVFKQMKILYSVPDPPAKFIMVCRANLACFLITYLAFQSHEGKCSRDAVRCHAKAVSHG